MPEYPTLRLNQQSLRNHFQQIAAKATHQLATYEHVGLARSAYYLRKANMLSNAANQAQQCKSVGANNL